MTGRKQSAYFPASRENSVSIQKEDVNKNNTPHPQYYPEPTGIAFPHTSTILWDREPIQQSKYLQSASIIPALSINPTDVRKILQHLIPGAKMNDDLRVCVANGNQMINDNILALHPTIKMPNYLFTTENECNNQCTSDTTLTIPINYHSADANSILFERESTNNLLLNLGKSIRAGREFSLRSCIRLRAAGYAVRSTSPSPSNYTHWKEDSSISSRENIYSDENLSGTIRMEAIVPDMSFKLTRIKPIQILSTALSQQLIKSDSRIFQENLKMGYITMNQTRKLVVLQETDVSISQTPQVGIWIRLNAQWCHNENEDILLEHPYIWGACVRFLNNIHIQTRAMVDTATFLLMLVLGEHLYYYEVAKLPGAVAASSTSPLSSPRDFLCTDFTLSLTVDSSEDLNNTSGVIGRFKPLTRPDHISAFLHSANETSSIQQHAPPTTQPLPPVQAQTQNPYYSSATIPSSSGSKAQSRSNTHHTASAFTATTPSHLSTRHTPPGRAETFSIESSSILAPRDSCPSPAIPPQSPAKRSPPRSETAVAASSVPSHTTGVVKRNIEQSIPKPDTSNNCNNMKQNPHPLSQSVPMFPVQNNSMDNSNNNSNSNNTKNRRPPSLRPKLSSTDPSIQTSHHRDYIVVEGEYATSREMLRSQLTDPKFPTDIILYQQRKIDAMQNTIDELTCLVRQLGGVAPSMEYLNCANMSNSVHQHSTSSSTRRNMTEGRSEESGGINPYNVGTSWDEVNMQSIRSSYADTLSHISLLEPPAYIPEAITHMTTAATAGSNQANSLSIAEKSHRFAWENNSQSHDFHTETAVATRKPGNKEQESMSFTEEGEYLNEEFEEEEEGSVLLEEEGSVAEHSQEHYQEGRDDDLRHSQSSYATLNSPFPGLKQQSRHNSSSQSIQQQRNSGLYTNTTTNTTGTTATATNNSTMSSTLKSTTATAKYSLGINNNNSTTTGTTIPTSSIERSRKSHASSSSGSSSSSYKTRSRLSGNTKKYLEDDFEDPTFVESESIMRIQARYM